MMNTTFNRLLPSRSFSQVVRSFGRFGPRSIVPIRLSSTSQIDEIYLRCVKRGGWGVKEPMDQYLNKALAISQRYVSQILLSPEEEAELKKIKEWYHRKYVPQSSTLLPFIKLEARGKTFEQAGGSYLSQEDIANYMHHGFIGPVAITSLTQADLRAISDRFQNFNRDYYKNLGSLYNTLSNYCLFRLATNPDILAKVSSILGEDVQLSNVTVHEIGSGGGKSSMETKGNVNDFNCHSDVSSGSHYYFKPEGNQVEDLALDNQGVCVWVSITGTTPRNAPLYLFPQTHLWEITTPFTYIENAKKNPQALDHVFKLLAFNHKNPARRIGLCALEYLYLLSSQYKPMLSKIHQTEIYTPPGSVIMFNQHCRHGSGFNYTQEPRLAISLRFNTALKEVGGTEWAGAVVTSAEKQKLGLGDDPRKPMLQLLGTRHHPNNVPIDLNCV